MPKLTTSRLFFYTSILGTTALVVTAVIPAGSKPVNQAYLPPMQVASLPPVMSVDVSRAQSTAATVQVTGAQVRPPQATPVSARSISGATPAIFSNTAETTDIPPETPRWFEPGAKVKLLVYERLADSELNKYGRTGYSEDDFQQRQEMSGEFMIGADNTLSLPLLGNFTVTGSTPQQLEAAIATAYEQKLKRHGFATITAITRPPVLILGPVKTPGKVDYTPNMTVLHAVAMAGGIKSGMGDDESWQPMERIRERISHNTANQDLADLFAQKAVLEAERDKIEPQVPETLLTLVGPAKAKAKIAIEQQRRSAIVAARQQQEHGLDEQLRAARQHIESLRQINMKTYDDALALAQKRVDAMQGFANQGTINNVQMLNVRAELENAKGRKQEVLARLSEAQQTIGRLEGEKALLAKATTSDVSSALATVRAQITANEDKRETSETILRALSGQGVMNIAYSAGTGDDAGGRPHWTYKIVRTTPQGPVEFAATDKTVLAPGDLVQITLGHGMPADEPVITPNLGPQHTKSPAPGVMPDATPISATKPQQ